MLNILVTLKYPNSMKRYSFCMGREEAFNFNLQDFYDPKFYKGPMSNFPITHPFRFVCILD